MFYLHSFEGNSSYSAPPCWHCKSFPFPAFNDGEEYFGDMFDSHISKRSRSVTNYCILEDKKEIKIFNIKIFLCRKNNWEKA